MVSDPAGRHGLGILDRHQQGSRRIDQGGSGISVQFGQLATLALLRTDVHRNFWNVHGEFGPVSQSLFSASRYPVGCLHIDLIAMAIQFALFIVVLVYESVIGGWTSAGWSMLMLPLLVLQLACLSLGAGLWMTALTVRFRDLIHALQFITLVLMFASLVFIPMANVSGELAILVWFNPLAVIIENFRASV